MYSRLSWICNDLGQLELALSATVYTNYEANRLAWQQFLTKPEEV